MIRHIILGPNEKEPSRQLSRLIKNGDVTFGGYEKGRIYGTLNCKSGKRMNLEHRVFFKDEKEARQAGYRPCAHCLPAKYKFWKTSNMTNK